jgi:tRNA threonylcarbamoyladenosine biosynthesis protein TsaB
MNLLAVETSTELCSIALFLNGEIVVNEKAAGQRHSDMLLGMTSDLLAEHQVSVADLDGFAFGAGPGSFTGLRIACGVVQGMALGAQRKVLGISSLLALAEASAGERVIAALDARMGETYLAAYEYHDARWQVVIEPCLVDASSLPALSGNQWLGIGSGFDNHAYLAEHYQPQLAGILTARLPSARAIVKLAAREFAAGGGIAPELAAPLYIRDKVALTIVERRNMLDREVVRS